MSSEANSVYSDPPRDEECIEPGCHRQSTDDSNFCLKCFKQHFHIEDDEVSTTVQKTQMINDHIKINIEQSSKGARVTVTYDRSDHVMEAAVNEAVAGYEYTLKLMKDKGLKVDES